MTFRVLAAAAALGCCVAAAATLPEFDRTDKGLFTVHRAGDRFFYEIPATELDREFVWNTRIAKTTYGASFSGALMADRVVRWHRSGKRIFLLDVNYAATAAAGSSLASAVSASNNETIIMSFDIAPESKDNAPVIEVTRLFTSDVPEFNIRQKLGATVGDSQRSFVERIAVYPENIEAEATLTWTRNDSLAVVPTGQMRPGSATVLVHHSMVGLPENPMMPRLFDDRVGYFQTGQFDYSRDEPRATWRSFIARWRLVKKNPAEAISEAVKPIVFYIDPATPPQYRAYVIRAAESWAAALEAAGFRNAITARLAPTAEEDPEFSAEDVRYSMVRWLASPVQNAFGPSVRDPRTGEILNATIEFHHNMMSLLRNWYVTQVGALDPRARQTPLPDDATGELIEYVLAHEFGHALGLEHNVRASSTYPQEKVRDREWVHRMGFTPSVMDYIRFNYVAQPEDGMALEDLRARVGPYDRWAIHWGYAPLDAASPDAERPTLNRWAREQDATPWLRYSVPWTGSDPGELAEAVGDADAVRSTALGLKNLRRVMEMLPGMESGKEGESYRDLFELYGAVFGQWSVELNHVVAIVGGYDSQVKYTGQPGRSFVPVSRARQLAALEFLQANAFVTPEWIANADIARRSEPGGVLARVRTVQDSVLNNLLSTARLSRMVESEQVDGGDVLPAAEFVPLVRKGIWSELDKPRVHVNAYRRALQRTYLDIAGAKNAGEERGLYRAELKTLRAQLTTALPKAVDRSTRAHLMDARDQIDRLMDGTGRNLAPAALRIAPVSATGAAGCWMDYSAIP